MEQKKEWIEDFWRTGYAIRLGKDQYFQEIRNKRIVTAKIWKAAFFQSLREAEIFAQKHLWYTGMDPQICYRAWVLVSIESEEEQELFWNGKQFVPELGKAKLFSSSQEMQTYVKRLGLSRQTYPELLPVEKKQMKNAAQGGNRMEIKNLAQLKRVIQEKREFIIRVHRQEKFLGQKRIPNVVQSNGFYSVISGQPEHEVSCANHGKGSWIDFGKATQWEFQEETCSMYLPEMEHIPENLIWTIEFCKDKKNIPQKLSCSILCNAYYHGELLLPEAIKTFPEALEYAKDHLDEIPLGEMNYIENSDVLDQENCELVAADSEEIPEDSSKENGLKSSKEEWWRIIEGIKEHESRLAEQGRTEDAEKIARGMDFFYPNDVVTEILKDGDGRISGIKRGEISLSDDDYYLADTQEPYSFRQVTWEDILRIMEEYSKNGYLPPIFSKGTVIWLSEEYEGDSKTSRFYYPMQLPPWKSLQMIRKLDCWYADTDLDRREYAEEYQRIVSGILHGLVILNPKKLALEEVIKEWEVNFTEPEKRGYRVVFDEIRKGKIPIVRDCNYITD